MIPLETSATLCLWAAASSASSALFGASLAALVPYATRSTHRPASFALRQRRRGNVTHCARYRGTNYLTNVIHHPQ